MLISSSENLLVRRRHGGQCEHGSTANFGFEKCDNLHPRAQVANVVCWAAKASKPAEARIRTAQKVRLAAWQRDVSKCVSASLCPLHSVRFTLYASLCTPHSACLPHSVRLNFVDANLVDALAAVSEHWSGRSPRLRPFRRNCLVTVVWTG